MESDAEDEPTARIQTSTNVTRQVVRALMMERERKCLLETAEIVSTTAGADLLSTSNESQGLFCPRTFDGWNCWNKTPAGSIVFSACPYFVPGFVPTTGATSLGRVQDEDQSAISASQSQKIQLSNTSPVVVSRGSQLASNVENKVSEQHVSTLFPPPRSETLTPKIAPKESKPGVAEIPEPVPAESKASVMQESEPDPVQSKPSLISQRRSEPEVAPAQSKSSRISQRRSEPEVASAVPEHVETEGYQLEHIANEMFPPIPSNMDLGPPRKSKGQLSLIESSEPAVRESVSAFNANNPELASQMAHPPSLEPESRVAEETPVSVLLKPTCHGPMPSDGIGSMPPSSCHTPDQLPLSMCHTPVSYPGSATCLLTLSRPSSAHIVEMSPWQRHPEDSEKCDFIKLYSNIFNRLSGTDLTSARLACEVWHDYSAPAFKAKTVFSYNPEKCCSITWNPWNFLTSSSEFLDYLSSSSRKLSPWSTLRITSATNTDIRLLVQDKAAVGEFKKTVGGIKELELITCFLEWDTLFLFLHCFCRLEALADSQSVYYDRVPLHVQLIQSLGGGASPDQSGVNTEFVRRWRKYRFRLKRLRIEDTGLGSSTALFMQVLRECLLPDTLEEFELAAGGEGRDRIGMVHFWVAAGELLLRAGAKLQRLTVRCNGDNAPTTAFDHFVSSCVESLNGHLEALTHLTLDFSFLWLTHALVEKEFIPFITRLEGLRSLSMRTIVMRPVYGERLESLKPLLPTCDYDFGVHLTDLEGDGAFPHVIRLVESSLYQLHMRSLSVSVHCPETVRFSQMLTTREDIGYPNLRTLEVRILHLHFESLNLSLIQVKFPALTELSIVDGPALHYLVGGHGLSSERQYARMSRVRFGDEDLQLLMLHYPQLKLLLLQLNMEGLTDTGLTGLSPTSIKRMKFRKDMMVHDPEYEISGHSLGDMIGLAYKECLSDGTWFRRFDNNRTWSNYTNCVDMEDLQWRRFIITFYESGYFISISALIISLVVFCSFKCLECTRVRIHKHLFVSFIISNVLWMAFYRLVVDDPDVALRSPNWCKVLHVLVQYFMVANYFWMFCEGFYLHTLLVLAFIRSDSALLKGFYIFGWTGPLIPILFYTYFRASDSDKNHSCWIEDSSWNHILSVPVCVSLILSLAFLINILRVLVKKLKDNHRNFTNVCRRNSSIGAISDNHLSLRKAVRATLILIPLLGLHYLLIPFRPRQGTHEAAIYDVVSAGVASLQGFCVSLLFCFCNSEVLVVFRRRLCHRLCNAVAKSPTLPVENSCAHTSMSIVVSSRRISELYTEDEM